MGKQACGNMPPYSKDTAIVRVGLSGYLLHEVDHGESAPPHLRKMGGRGRTRTGSQ